MDVRSLYERVADFRVLLIGDAILDEYQYVTVLGKASKENLMATRLERRERFHGGVLAAAAHVRNFCREVVVHSGRSQMLKRRYVDEVYMRKLFEVQDALLLDVPEESCPDPRDFDLVIVTDFGHGCVTRELIPWLIDRAPFLAVNAQSNAANYGFNLITKYPRADFVVIDEPEARLAAQNAEGPIEDVIRNLGFPRIIVTHGAHGSIGYDGTWHRARAYTQTVVDTMGAGDAFLCLTAPLAAAGVPMQELVHIGNAAGAAKVGIVGHRRAVTREDIETILRRESLGAGHPGRPARVSVRERRERRECAPSGE